MTTRDIRGKFSSRSSSQMQRIPPGEVLSLAAVAGKPNPKSPQTKKGLAPRAIKAVCVVKLRWIGTPYGKEIYGRQYGTMVMSIPRQVMEITGWIPDHKMLITGLPDGTAVIRSAGEEVL